MKTYTITVNGTAYEVTVEEGSTGATTAPAAKIPTAPKMAAPKPVVAGSEGSIKINSPMPGKILNVKTSVGAAVKKGEVILLLEAMKMENEIVATQDGVVATINVNAGDEVEAGAVLVTLN